jgi:hypothetical protein
MARFAAVIDCEVPLRDWAEPDGMVAFARAHKAPACPPQKFHEFLIKAHQPLCCHTQDLFRHKPHWNVGNVTGVAVQFQQVH